MKKEIHIQALHLSFHPHTLLRLFLSPGINLGTDNLREPFKQLKWDLRRNTVALTNTPPYFTSTRQMGHVSFQATQNLSRDTDSLQHEQMLTWDLPGEGLGSNHRAGMPGLQGAGCLPGEKPFKSPHLTQASFLKLSIVNHKPQVQAGGSAKIFLWRSTLRPSFVFCFAFRREHKLQLCWEGFKGRVFTFQGKSKKAHHKWDTGNPVLLEITPSQEVNKWD